MGARILTDPQIDQIVAWREAGLGCSKIARRLGVSIGAIEYQCLRHGAASPKQTRHPVPNSVTIVRRKNGRTLSRFTQADDVRLLELEEQGLSNAAIGRAMGRATSSIRNRLLALALHDDLTPTPLTEGAAA